LSSPRVFLYVQHLLGIGHLTRAATLARALASAGLQTTLVSGGSPVPAIAAELAKDGVRLLQLPAASAADLSFRTLLDEAGRVVDEAWRRRRTAELLRAYEACDPQVLVLELFPFGRRQMRFELLPLLEAAAAAPRRPFVACSVRDILGGRKSAERQEETLQWIARYFDRVLVHGDPAILEFGRSFPFAERIAAKLHYTGYVVNEAPASGCGADPGAGKDEVLVSAGGGAVGAALLEAAIRARPLSSLRDRVWRVLAGNNLPQADFRRFADLIAADSGIVLERSRPDFVGLLSRCALSISQAGYNTLMETLRAGARAVVVPFAAGQETEQTLRARCFAERGFVQVLEEASLTPAALAAAVDRAVGRPRPGAGAANFSGAANSAALVARWAREGVA